MLQEGIFDNAVRPPAIPTNCAATLVPEKTKDDMGYVRDDITTRWTEEG